MRAHAEDGSEFRAWEKDRSITNVGQGSKNFVQIGVWVETVQLVIETEWEFGGSVIGRPKGHP